MCGRNRIGEFVPNSLPSTPSCMASAETSSTHDSKDSKHFGSMKDFSSCCLPFLGFWSGNTIFFVFSFASPTTSFGLGTASKLCDVSIIDSCSLISESRQYIYIYIYIYIYMCRHVYIYIYV